MANKKVIYACDYCGKEYGNFDECEKHEKTHIRSYKDADTNEIVNALRELGENAYGYHIGSMVIGMPVSNFESLLNEAAKRLEENLNGVLSDDDIDTFNSYLEEDDMPAAFGNTDWISIYNKIVGNRRTEKLEKWMEDEEY